jgi:hypothetical protein
MYHVFDFGAFLSAASLLELFAEDVYLYGSASTFCLSHTSMVHYAPSPA